MPAFDFIALESIEYDACGDMYRAAPEEIRRAHDMHTATVAGVTCLTCRGIEPAVMFRRVVHLGVREAARQAQLQEVLAYSRVWMTIRIIWERVKANLEKLDALRRE